MKILPRIFTLKDEAQNELYQWFDKNIRPLHKKADGSIDPSAHGLEDNDVDAMRHAYVSGVYTLEYDEKTAELLGRLNEVFDFDSSNRAKSSENMDLWNNSVGRYYGARSRTRAELLEKLFKALKNFELITDPNDQQKYKGKGYIKRKPKSFVIKIKESKTGANIEFLDIRNKILMSKQDFIAAIKNGSYPGYSVRKHKEGEYPFSIRDKFQFNNLG